MERVVLWKESVEGGEQHRLQSVHWRETNPNKEEKRKKKKKEQGKNKENKKRIRKERRKEIRRRRRRRRRKGVAGNAQKTTPNMSRVFFRQDKGNGRDLDWAALLVFLRE